MVTLLYPNNKYPTKQLDIGKQNPDHNIYNLYLVSVAETNINGDTYVKYKKCNNERHQDTVISNLKNMGLSYYDASFKDDRELFIKHFKIIAEKYDNDLLNYYLKILTDTYKYCTWRFSEISTYARKYDELFSCIGGFYNYWDLNKEYILKDAKLPLDYNIPNIEKFVKTVYAEIIEGVKGDL